MLLSKDELIEKKLKNFPLPLIKLCEIFLLRMEVTVDKLKSFHNFSSSSLKFGSKKFLAFFFVIYDESLGLLLSYVTQRGCSSLKRLSLAYFRWKIAEIPAKGISIVIQMIDSCVMLWKFIFFQPTASSHTSAAAIHLELLHICYDDDDDDISIYAWMCTCKKCQLSSLHTDCVWWIFIWSCDKVMLQLRLLGQHRYHFSSHSA